MSNTQSPALSIDAAAALSGISRSTLWRRTSDGQLRKGEKDARGRATVLLDDVLALLPCPLSPAACTLLLQADAGEAMAQAELGALLYLDETTEAALYWWHAAAEQGNAEAMQWLGVALAREARQAAPEDPEQARRARHLAVMWIARAAAGGHAIAQSQLGALLP